VATGKTGTRSGGSELSGGAGAVLDRAGVYHAFAITSHGVLEQAYYTGGAWHRQGLGGTVAGTPGVAYDAADDRFDVFAPSPNGELYQKMFLAHAWHAWHVVGGSGFASAGTDQAMTTPDEDAVVP
jgi:hypothetical protein